MDVNSNLSVVEFKNKKKLTNTTNQVLDVTTGSISLSEVAAEKESWP